MAKYDQGGGCPCGLYRECEPKCEHHPDKEKARMAALEQKLRDKKHAEAPEIYFAGGMIKLSVLPRGAMNADIMLYHEHEERQMEPDEIGSLIRWLLDNYTAPMKRK